MSVMLRNGEVITKASPRRVDWCYLTTGTHGRDIIAYCFAPVEVAAAPESESAPIEVAPHPDAQSAPIGGKLPDDSYYIVEIKEPMSPGLKPCVVECADIIEALDLTFNEGEAFKAIWRLGKTRQGVGKAGNSLQYEADKVGHYGTRVAIQTKRSTG